MEDLEREKKRMDLWWKNRRKIAWLSFFLLCVLILMPYVALFLGFEIEKTNPFFDTSIFVLGSIVLSYFGFSTLEEIQDRRNKK